MAGATIAKHDEIFDENDPAFLHSGDGSRFNKSVFKKNADS
jgi:hypothetical protein